LLISNLNAYNKITKKYLNFFIPPFQKVEPNQPFEVLHNFFKKLLGGAKSTFEKGG
jgi:hypothetical protein